MTFSLCHQTGPNFYLGYWTRLASSLHFSGKTIKACIRVLHTDIVRVWNIQDEFGVTTSLSCPLMLCLLRISPQHLESKEFKALMTTLAGEQYDELSDPNTTL